MITATGYIGSSDKNGKNYVSIIGIVVYYKVVLDWSRRGRVNWLVP